MNFAQAKAIALQEVADGFGVSVITDWTPETGSRVQLETESGWNPVPFWQEISPDDYNPLSDY